MVHHSPAVRRGVRSTLSPSVQLEGRNHEEEEEEEDEQPMDVDERGRESSPLESTIDLGNYFMWMERERELKGSLVSPELRVFPT